MLPNQKKIFLYGTAAIIFLSTILSSCAKEPMPTAIADRRRDLLPKGTIFGTVLDEQNQPLLGVQIATDQGYSAISRAQGAFVIEELPKGAHWVHFIRYGYLDTAVYIEELGINADLNVNQVVLHNGLSSVSGTVLSASGEPLGNAAVVLTDHPFHTKTDENGRFTLQRISPDVSRVMAAHEDHGWGQLLLDLSPGVTQQVTIHLREGKVGTVSGKVYKDGKPDSGAIVTAFGGAYTDTAVDGTYRLENIPCAVPLSISSGARRLVSGVLIAPNDTTMTIDLPELHSVRKGEVSIVERRIYALAQDSVTMYADVRVGDELSARYDSAAVFLWKTGNGDEPFDTCTSEPFLTVKPGGGRDYAYGIISASGDTLCCTDISFVVPTTPVPEIVFSEESFFPVNVAVETTDSLTLSWSAYDVGGRPLVYTLFFGDSRTDPPSRFCTGIVDTFLTVRPPDGWAAGSYLWQVEAQSSRVVKKSPVMSFRLAQ